MMNGQIERIRDKSETDIFFEHRDRLPLKSLWYHLGMVQVQKLLLYAGEQFHFGRSFIAIHTTAKNQGRTQQ